MRISEFADISKQLTNLALDINKLCQQESFKSAINPIALEMINKINMYDKPAILILSVSLLRFSDAKKLLSNYPILPDSMIFQQGKTKRFIHLDFSIIPLSIREQIFSITKQFGVFNYGRVSNSIYHYCLYNLSNFKLSFNNKTHLFRHLQASWLKSNNFSNKHIQEKLGHVDNNAIYCYFHDELFL